MAEQHEITALHGRAVAEFEARVRAVGSDQWHEPTPCSEWDVHDLVNHLVNENCWTTPLLEGRTMAEVGDRFDGDLLGDDPVGSWESASRQALVAVAEPGALERIVHVSFGDITGQEYVSQLTTDHTIHAWDLARAIGADEELDPVLVDFSYEYLAPLVDGWRAAGAFGPAVAVQAGADRQTELLAMAGRQV